MHILTSVPFNQCPLTRQLILERQLHIARIQRRCLNKAQAILARKLLRLLRRHSPQMPQITLVAHQHDHNIRVRMISQLLQPPRHILVGLVLGDVVDEQSAHGAAIVGGGDGAVALLAGRVPDLGLDRLAVDLDAAGREFDADGGFAVEIELVAGETREEVGFSDAGVAYEDDFEEELRASSVVSCLCMPVFCLSYIVLIVRHGFDVRE